MKKKMYFFILTIGVIGALFSGCASSELPLNDVKENVTIDKEDEKEQGGTTDDMPQGDSHEHSYAEEITKEPTCDERGVITYTCACGDSYTEETSFMDHCTDRSEITKEATCTEEGILTFYCRFCGAEVYTEPVAKLPHNENCNHETADAITDPKDYTFTQCFKILYVTERTGYYSKADENSHIYAYAEVGEAVPIIAKCDQANFYRTIHGGLILGTHLTEERPVNYGTGEEAWWENLVEETDGETTYVTGIYHVNGYEVHCNRENTMYIEKQFEYARQGLYTIMYKPSDTIWSGHYSMMIEDKNYYRHGDYLDWLVLYMESMGYNVPVESMCYENIYLSPKDENSKKLIIVSVSISKTE